MAAKKKTTDEQHELKPIVAKPSVPCCEKDRVFLGNARRLTDTMLDSLRLCSECRAEIVRAREATLTLDRAVGR